MVVGDLVKGDASEAQAIVGGDPNIAARIQSLAEPEVVVVAASTRQLLGDLFTLRDLGHREVKKAFPNPWRLGGGRYGRSANVCRESRRTYHGRHNSVESTPLAKSVWN